MIPVVYDVRQERHECARRAPQPHRSRGFVVSEVSATPRTRVCRTDGCPELIPSSRRHCATHAREYEQQRGTRQQRGYDADHERLRKQIQTRIDRGHPVPCVTCGVLLVGRDWDLGHDHDHGGHLGPQCVPCNRGDGGRRAH